MLPIARRPFLRVIGGAAFTALTGTPSSHASPRSSLEVGMGLGTRAWGGISAQSQLEGGGLALLTHAYAKGIRIFDMADAYGVHGAMNRLLQSGVPRSELVLMTKTLSRKGDGVRRDLDRFLSELGTDYLDVVFLHCVSGAAWPEKLHEAMAVLSEAQSRGVVREVGVTCHGLDALRAAAACPWGDVVMLRFNPYGEKMDAPLAAVQSTLHDLKAAGKRVFAMKLMGHGGDARKLDRSLQFAAAETCIDAAVVGFTGEHEIDQAFSALARTLA